jgi:hypothetical protein
MANPFQDFIQLELPKRPFLDADVPQETVMVRRGNAPRQLAAVSLVDGEVLGKVDGALAAVTPSSAFGVQFVQTEAAATWTIAHGRTSTKVIALLLDSSGNKIEADNVSVQSETVVVSFIDAQAGKANLMFL